jgi:tetratricopeptide (TPR) repeat protein
VALETAVRLNPYNSMAYGHLGDIRLAAGDTLRALEAYDRALETGGWNHGAANSAAWIRAVRGEDLEHALAIARAITKDVEDANYFDTLGWVYYRKGDLDAAAKALERACDLKPDGAEPLFHLAIVERARGRTERMKELLSRVVQVDRTGDFGAKAREMLDQ